MHVWPTRPPLMQHSPNFPHMLVDSCHYFCLGPECPDPDRAGSAGTMLGSAKVVLGGPSLHDELQSTPFQRTSGIVLTCSAQCSGKKISDTVSSLVTRKLPRCSAQLPQVAGGAFMKNCSPSFSPDNSGSTCKQKESVKKRMQQNFCLYMPGNKCRLWFHVKSDGTWPYAHG